MYSECNQALVTGASRLPVGPCFLRVTLCRRTLGRLLNAYKAHPCAMWPAGVMLQSALPVFLRCTCRSNFQKSRHELSIHVLSGFVSVPCSGYTDF